MAGPEHGKRRLGPEESQVDNHQSRFVGLCSGLDCLDPAARPHPTHRVILHPPHLFHPAERLAPLPPPLLLLLLQWQRPQAAESHGLAPLRCAFARSDGKLCAKKKRTRKRKREKKKAKKQKGKKAKRQKSKRDETRHPMCALSLSIQPASQQFIHRLLLSLGSPATGVNIYT